MAISNKVIGKIAELQQGASTPTLCKLAQVLLSKSLFDMCQGSTTLTNNELNAVVAELKSIGTPNALNLINTLA